MIRDRAALATTPARETALACVAAGVAAALPATVVPETVTRDSDVLHVGDAVYDLATYDRVLVLGGGKAAAAVARELAAIVGDDLDGGLVVTDDPAGRGREDPEAVDAGPVEVRHGDHPVPSERGAAATRDLLAMARDADEDDLVIAVVTGGGSALLAAPAGELSLDDLRATTEALLAAGVPIDDVNTVRKHCSAIKGGQLATALAPATVATLVLSDVVGDDPAVVASGPTVPDRTTAADALAVVDDAAVDVPPAVREHLASDAAATPDSDQRAFASVAVHEIASSATAVTAAVETARERGYRAVRLATDLTGAASAAGRFHAAVGREVADAGEPVESPAVLVTGGELTVTVTGDGAGGPNQECALAAAVSVPADAAFAAVDTDGIDGASDAAGAVVDDATVTDVAAAEAALRDNDAGGFLADAEPPSLIRTGPTGTNVNDLRVIVVE